MRSLPLHNTQKTLDLEVPIRAKNLSILGLDFLLIFCYYMKVGKKYDKMLIFDIYQPGTIKKSPCELFDCLVIFGNVGGTQ